MSAYVPAGDRQCIMVEGWPVGGELRNQIAKQKHEHEVAPGGELVPFSADELSAKLFPQHPLSMNDERSQIGRRRQMCSALEERVLESAPVKKRFKEQSLGWFAGSCVDQFDLITVEIC